MFVPYLYSDEKTLIGLIVHKFQVKWPKICHLGKITCQNDFFSDIRDCDVRYYISIKFSATFH